MPLSMTPGSSIIVMVQFSDADMAFAEFWAARHSQNSRNPLHAGHVFRGFPIHLRYGLPGCSPPFDGSDQVSPAPEGFYFQASGSLVTLTAAGYNYNMDWTSFCWRDLHPLEWQLASLHQNPPCGVTAVGSSGRT